MKAHLVAVSANEGALVPKEAHSAIAKYNAMCLAIKECHDIDMAKEMQSQAAALALYHAQANDTKSENLMREIRIRAQRRAGEILALMRERGQRATGHGNVAPGKRGADIKTSPQLADLGITQAQASEWQALARIPEPVFEQHLSDLRAIGKRPVLQNIAAFGRATARKSRVIMGDPTAPVTPRTEKPKTAADHACKFRLAIMDLAAITLDPADMQDAFMEYEYSQVQQNLNAAVAFLLAVQRVWRLEA